MAFFPTNFMLASHDHEDHHSISPILHTSTTDHHQFHGKRWIGEEDLWDDGGEKKRRLNMEQVRTLERNFELGNKLDPERKMQLATALGLQPRQIAIWFQNRRARWKTKQLEKDYDVLKKQFQAIKAQNHSLLSQNHKLHAQIMALKSKEPIESINLNVKETEGSCSNNSCDIKLDISTTHVYQQNPSLRPDDHFHRQNIDQSVTIKEESLCNMFVSMEDHSRFWPWLEQPPQLS